MFSSRFSFMIKRYIRTTTTIKFLISEDTPSITQGFIGEIYLKAGDKVTLKTPIMEIETDKYTAKEFSTVNGVIKCILVEKETYVPNFAPLFTIEYETSEQ